MKRSVHFALSVPHAKKLIASTNVYDVNVFAGQLRTDIAERLDADVTVTIETIEHSDFEVVLEEVPDDDILAAAAQNAFDEAVDYVVLTFWC